MKKRLYAGLLALVLMFSMTACGKPAENPNPEQGTQGTENVDSSEKNEKPENSDILGGVYAGGEKLEEIVMGTMVNGEQVEFCKVKVPSNYLTAAVYIDEEGDDHTFEMASGTQKLQMALEHGLLEQSEKIQTITMRNDADVVSYIVFSPEELNYEEFKQEMPNGSEIGSGDYEAFYFERDEVFDMMMHIKLGDKGVLRMGYKGSAFDEFGIDQLAQNIYDLITVIE